MIRTYGALLIGDDLRIRDPYRRAENFVVNSRFEDHKMQVSVQQTFISIGCNRNPNAAATSPLSGRLAFGAYTTIALWKPGVSR